VLAFYFSSTIISGDSPARKMAIKQAIRFRQRLNAEQIIRLQNTDANLRVSQSEVTRIALEKYRDADALDSLSHKIRTPVA
jgi:hypothetical protein